MPRLNFSSRDLARGVAKLGLDLRAGSELNGWYKIDGKAIHPVTVPRVHRGDVSKWVLGKVRHQMQLDADQFADLVNCPMSSTEYEMIWRARLERT